MLRRRTALQLGGAALAGGLARPAIGQGDARTLRFVSPANLSTVDIVRAPVTAFWNVRKA